MWYEWNNLEDFNTWHDAKCVELGIPNGLTTAYTQAYEVETKFIAFVEDEHSEGLTATDLRLPKRVEDESLAL
jgi:hypothetical protein